MRLNVIVNSSWRRIQSIGFDTGSRFVFYLFFCTKIALIQEAFFPHGYWQRLIGVSFDETLSRLGHGKGYYDHFLSMYSERVGQQSQKPYLREWFFLQSSLARPFSHVPKVALALREQISSTGQIPMAEHDHRMNAVASPDGIICDEAISAQ